MTTSKKSTPTANSTKGNTVRNTKAKFNTGTNKLAESLIKRSFTPLVSPKDGKSRLTFCGVEHSVSKDGNNPFMKLVFSCLDVTHDAPANIAILSSYRYSEQNKLGKFLALLGYVPPAIEYQVIDEEDEFGMKANDSGVDGIFEFLRERCGLVFKAELVMSEKRAGLYQIDIATIEPMMKNGEQVTDYMASDVSDEVFENPSIDIDDESQN